MKLNHSAPNFFAFCLPRTISVKIINGEKLSKTNVNFHHEKLTASADISAPKLAPIRLHAADDNLVTSAPKLFSSKLNQPISLF